MNCDEFLSLIDSMIDGELSVESTARVNAHADQCDTCGPERDRLMVLHERMQHLGASIAVPASLEGRVKAALATEVAGKSSEPKVFKISSRFLMVAAAVIICLIAAGLYIVKTHVETGMQIADTTHSSVVSITDLANHTHAHIVSDFKYSPDQLPALAKQTGFAIKPPVIPNWRLASVCVCSVGRDGLPVAHMTYLNTNKKSQQKELTCYQVLGKNFNQTGLAKAKENELNSVLSSKISELAVAAVKQHEVENIFFGAMPLKELIGIASHT